MTVCCACVTAVSIARNLCALHVVCVSYAHEERAQMRVQRVRRVCI